MGCCASRHKNFSSEIIDSIKIDSIQPVQEYFKLHIYELHLTKSHEKVLKSPSNYSFKISTSKELQETQPIQFQGLHYTFLSPPELIFRIPSNTLTISLMGHKYSNTTLIGSIKIDLDLFKVYSYFKGVSHIWYRCCKMGTVLFEVNKITGDSDYMTMTEQKKSVLGQFLPSIEYPENSLVEFNPTPKFNTLNLQYSGDYTKRDSEKIRVLKEKNVDFEYLLDCLHDDTAEILYYVFDKLEFFAFQKNYSERIPIGVVLDKIGRFGSDRFVAYKALWLIYCLIDSSKQVLESFQSQKIMGILHVIEQFYSKECSVIGLEILLMYAEGNLQQLIKIVPELEEIILKLLAETDSPEIIAGCLALIQKIMGTSGKPEYWHMIIANGTLKFLSFYINEYILNNEIVSSSLKILVSYALSNTFTKTLSTSINPSSLITVYSVYFSDKTKIKSLSQIFCQILPFIHKDELSKVLRILIKILKNHFNSKEIVKITIKGLKKVLKNRPESVESLLTDKAVDLYIDLFSNFSEELAINGDFVKFIYELGLKSDKIKEFVWKNDGVKEALESINISSPVSSTGSSVSHTVNIKIPEMVSAILNYEN